MRRRAAWRPVTGAALGAVLLAASGTAQAASAFAGLGGSWAGAGHIRLENGQRESIRCSASYVPKSGGTAMGLSLPTITVTVTRSVLPASSRTVYVKVSVPTNPAAGV